MKEKILKWCIENKDYIVTAVVFGTIGTICGFVKATIDIKAEESSDIYEIADQIREFGSAQIWCSDGEPICIRKDGN